MINDALRLFLWSSSVFSRASVHSVSFRTNYTEKMFVILDPRRLGTGNWELGEEGKLKPAYDIYGKPISS